MKSIAERLKPGNQLSAKHVVTLLREQARLADQLYELVTERQKVKLEEARKREEQARSTSTESTPTEVKNGLNN